MDKDKKKALVDQKPTRQAKKHPYHKQTVIQEIRDTCAKHGIVAGSIIIKQRYSDVEQPTLWRWMKEAKAGPIEVATDRVRQAMAIIPQDVMPVPPPAASIVGRPRAVEGLDFMSKLEELYADAELLRKYSVKKEADGSDGVKVPVFFGNSIKLRSDLLERWLDAQRVLFDFEQMKGFYSTIIEEISKLDKPTATRIMERLDQVNRAKGFNISNQI